MPSTVPTPRIWLALGALGGFLSVGLGAFAAHGLEGRIAARLLTTFSKGVDYQALHSLALLLTGLLMLHFPGERRLRWAAAAFAAGILLFCGSLYVLALSGTRAWGLITPFGGVAFLVGWVLLGWGVWRSGETLPAPDRAGQGRQQTD